MREREIEACPAGVERHEVVDGEGDVGEPERIGTRLGARDMSRREVHAEKARLGHRQRERNQRAALAAAELDHARAPDLGHRQAVQPGKAREPVRMHRGKRAAVIGDVLVARLGAWFAGRSAPNPDCAPADLKVTGIFMLTGHLRIRRQAQSTPARTRRPARSRREPASIRRLTTAPSAISAAARSSRSSAMPFST